MTAKKQISVEEFDQVFDAGEDITDYLDLEKAVRIDSPKSEVRRVNVDFPNWMLDGLDKAAGRLAINRQAVIKTWIADRLRQERIA